MDVKEKDFYGALSEFFLSEYRFISKKPDEDFKKSFIYNLRKAWLRLSELFYALSLPEGGGTFSIINKPSLILGESFLTIEKDNPKLQQSKFWFFKKVQISEIYTSREIFYFDLLAVVKKNEKLTKDNDLLISYKEILKLLPAICKNACLHVSKKREVMTDEDYFRDAFSRGKILIKLNPVEFKIEYASIS